MELQHYRMTDVGSQQFLIVNFQENIYPTGMAHVYQTQDSMAEKFLILGRASQFLMMKKQVFVVMSFIHFCQILSLLCRILRFSQRWYEESSFLGYKAM
jgi:hypothetical protein